MQLIIRSKDLGEGHIREVLVHFSVIFGTFEGERLEGMGLKLIVLQHLGASPLLFLLPPLGRFLSSLPLLIFLGLDLLLLVVLHFLSLLLLLAPPPIVLPPLPLLFVLYPRIIIGSLLGGAPTLLAFPIESPFESLFLYLIWTGFLLTQK